MDSRKKKIIFNRDERSAAYTKIINYCKGTIRRYPGAAPQYVDALEEIIRCLKEAF